MNEQIQKIAKHPATIPSGVGLISFGLGVGLGFFLGRKTKKTPPADLHILPTVDLDLKVEETPKKKLDVYIVQTEEEGVLVLNKMNEVIDEYGGITLQDLKELLGLPVEEEDDEWCWTSLEYGMVEKGRGGYMLVLPDPEPLTQTPTDDEEVDKAVEVGREFIKNRFVGLPDITDDDLVEIEEDEEDETEDEESEEEEVSVPEEGTEDAVSEPPSARRENAFATGGDTWDLLKELKGRTESAPYILHRDEFHADEKDYRQYSLTYYAGDNIMTNEDDDEVMYNHDRVVGELKWGHGSGSPIMVFVRNDKLRAEYEITYVDGLYSEEVQGLEIENNQRVKNLEHSSEPRRFRDRTE